VLSLCVTMAGRYLSSEFNLSMWSGWTGPEGDGTDGMGGVAAACGAVRRMLANGTDLPGPVEHVLVSLDLRHGGVFGR